MVPRFTAAPLLRVCLVGVIVRCSQKIESHTFMDLDIQAELDTPDDQLAALWALNLEQEELYQVRKRLHANNSVACDRAAASP